MTPEDDDRSGEADHRQKRRAVILSAAIERFSAQGFSGTSMADIADAASMSRPALYQDFRNKGDIFASAFVSLIDEQIDRSLGELAGPGTVAERLDGFLQHYEGDLWERMDASPHSEEILSAKSEQVVDAIGAAVERLMAGLAAYLDEVGEGVEPARRAEWAELLRLSPKGFKFDQPPVAAYRRRLTALARSVAADIGASQRSDPAPW